LTIIKKYTIKIKFVALNFNMIMTSKFTHT